ncbi:MAG: cobalt-precorrin-6A reductase [Proteobacteria bacterium]|nr:cobalt-precorrin-6A reductase [Pseudomonadota bacterium]
MPVKHLLILGGTTEARELARRVSLMMGKRVRVTTSLAGRRATTPALAGDVRIGGFGGIEGMTMYIRDNAVDVVVDATHPFAAQISDHANVACTGARVPRLQILRPGWRLPPGATCLEVDGLNGAARILPRVARRIFLTTGLGGLEAFSGLDDLWFLVRLIDAPKAPPPLAEYQLITGAPPYTLEEESRLLTEHDIDTLVTKDSGGAGTEAKIVAASDAGITIILVRRPPPEPGPVVATVDAAFAWVQGLI